jgi:glutamate/tyrosine decarboxylase-like PLP-dependent enzyme
MKADGQTKPAPQTEQLSRRERIERHLREKPLFILPDGSNREAVRRLGQQFLDLTIAALAGAGKRPALYPEAQASATPAVAVPLPITAPYRPPAVGRGADELIRIIRERVLSRALNVSHPGYVGHMDTLASAIGAFSDILVSALNNNMLCWEMSPVFTEMEARLLQWVTRAIGWPRAGENAPATGFLVSGGSLANLSAILAARNVMSGAGFREEGLSAAPGPPVIFASQEVHYSLDKIANILGLGARGLVRVPTDDQLRLRPDALAGAIAEARRSGRWPFCVVGIAGTTLSGAIDPLREIGEIARREGLWYHIDAAYGGSLLACSGGDGQDARRLLSGISAADSVTFNPQKWLFVPKVCAGIFFRDAQRVSDAVRQDFPYTGMGTGAIDDARRNVGEYTIQGTRRVDVLKLWLTLEHFGLDFLSALMLDCLDRARRFAKAIASEETCELFSPPQLNIVCFRFIPPTWDPQERAAEIDDLNQQIYAVLSREGPGWISLPRHRGRRYLRLVILHPLADERLLNEILRKVVATGRRLI